MKTQVWMQMIIVFALSRHCAAQIVPDQTLPAGERSQVSGNSNIQIDGGAVRGSNLFHSFQQFSVPTSGSATFNNPASVTNIITRVTGSDLSRIDGLIRTNGTANLFLINPNGIVFGANAQLAISGSFLATTANRLKFADGSEFDAKAAQAPLLTISAPIGLQYGSNPGAIQVQGATLQVPNGQTLSLAGSNITVNGGQLLAPGGRVELTGVAAAGEVGLMQQGREWRLSVLDGLTRADVAIGNGAIVDVAAGGGGSIGITAQNFTITGIGTYVQAGIATGLGTVGTQAGDIVINTTGATNINTGTVQDIVNTGGTGNAGDIKVTAGSLTFINGGNLDASTYGTGDAGNVMMTIRGAATFDGVTPDGTQSGAYSFVDSGARGKGGNIELSAGSLTLTNGGEFNADTYGIGDGGNVMMTVRGAATFDGVTPAGGFTTRASSQVNPGARGKGGNVELSAGSLTVTHGASLSSATAGTGDAGNVTLKIRGAATFDGTSPDGNDLSSADSLVFIGGEGKGGNVELSAGSLTVTHGANLNAVTFGTGDAGNVTLKIRGTATFDGTSADGRFPSGVGSLVFSGANGKGGNVNLSADLVSLTNGAALSVSSQGQGGAGNLDVSANQLRLDNQGSIQAETVSGQGGNITLQVRDLLLLRHDSFIATSSGASQAVDSNIISEAGGRQVRDLLLLPPSSFTTRAATDQGSGDGGNITLNSNLIVAVPQENSTISANAFSGRGGSIRITTQGLFGIEPRASTTTGLSSITASSEFGISGTITLNTPDVDPSRGTATLPNGVVDINALIASSCVVRRSHQGRFVITGTGGLATQPDDLANAAFPTYELVPNPAQAENVRPSHSSSSEADRIYRLPTGAIVLGRSCH